MPRESATGVVLGIAGAVTAFALVWHIGWLGAVGCAAILIAVIARSFVRDVHRVVSASEVERTERVWLRAVAETRRVTRGAETNDVNRGLAEVAG